jgi:hypothetical protein
VGLLSIPSWRERERKREKERERDDHQPTDRRYVTANPKEKKKKWRVSGISNLLGMVVLVVAPSNILILISYTRGVKLCLLLAILTPRDGGLPNKRRKTAEVQHTINETLSPLL